MRKVHKVQSPTALPKRKRVAAYARVSCDKDTMLHSLSAQISSYSDYIQKRRDWEFAGIYAEAPHTGTKANRPEFQRLLTDCRAGLIDMVITKSISRFARNTLTTLETVRELKSLGIEVWFERENIYSLSGDGELMLTILSSFAQEESLSASQNKLWQVQKQLKQGKTVGFTGMYGYNYSDGQISINEEQAAVVRQMFDWYIGGLGEMAISKRLNEQGISSYLGGKWHPNRVGELLRNEKLTGNAILQKYYTVDHISKLQKRNRGERDSYFAEGTHPAIIDTATFKTAQRIRQERAAHFNVSDTSQNTYPFSSMIVCEHCGKRYKRKKAAGGFRWQCSTYLEKGKAACPAKQIPEETLLAVTTEVLGLAVFDEAVFKNNITEIHIPGDNRLVFIFSGGRIVHREWQDRSRSESWTEEKRQQAREHAIRHTKGGSSK